MKKVKLYLGCLATLAALSACVDATNDTPKVETVSTEVQAERVKAGSNGDRTALRADLERKVLDIVLPTQFASQIGKNCRSYSYNKGKAERVFQTAEKDLRAQGYSKSDFQSILRNLPKATIQHEMLTWISKRGIVVGDKPTFCRAGAQEIAEGTDVAQYLIVK